MCEVKENLFSFFFKLKQCPSDFKFWMAMRGRESESEQFVLTNPSKTTTGLFFLITKQFGEHDFADILHDASFSFVGFMWRFTNL